MSRGRRPYIPDKVLKGVASNEFLRQADAIELFNHNQSDISRAFAELRRKGCIVDAPSPTMPHGRGRKGKPCRITETGLLYLIGKYDDRDCFWHALASLYNFDKDFRKKAAFALFDLFNKRHLHYEDWHGFFFFQPIMHRLVYEWHNEISARSVNSQTLRILLIALAKNPGVSVDLLRELIHSEPEQEIEKAIKLMTISEKTLAAYDTTSQFLRLCILEEDHGTRKTTYRLSCAGLMLTMGLLRKESIGAKIESYARICDEIVNKNRDTLPLIFARYESLKSLLGRYAAQNFDYVTGIISVQNQPTSILSGGYAELHSDAFTLAYNARERLILFLQAGISDFQSTRLAAKSNKHLGVQRYSELIEYLDSIVEFRPEDKKKRTNAEQDDGASDGPLHDIMAGYAQGAALAYYFALVRTDYNIDDIKQKITLNSIVNAPQAEPNNALAALVKHDVELNTLLSSSLEQIKDYREDCTEQMTSLLQVLLSSSSSSS